MDKKYFFLSLAGKNLQWFAFLLFLLFFAFQCYSQGYQVHHYSVADGLPNANVYDVTQDHWAGCGLPPAVGFLVMTVFPGKTLQKRTVSRLLFFSKISVDQKGRIWALLDPERLGKLSVLLL